jgi:hypothetical protein
MKYSICKKICLLVFIVSLWLPAISQNGNPLQFLRGVSQSSVVNPAFRNKTDKLVVGLPIVSGANINWGANFSAENLTSEQFSFDFQKFYDSLNETGNAFSAAQVPLIYLSLNKKNKTYSFSVTEKTIGTTNFDNEFLNFAAQGLLPYYNNNEQFSPMSLKTQYYREIALGYSTEIREGLTVGFRPKVLFGRFNYNIDNVTIDVSTNNETNQLIVSPTGSYSVSGPVKLVISDEYEAYSVQPDIKPSDYFFKFKNMGAGVDIGLTYNFNKQTEVALSVLDFGFTSLKSQTYNFEFTESLHYNENRLYQSSDSLAPNYWSPQYAMRIMADSIPYISTILEANERKINALPLQINAQFKHTLTNKIQLGVSNHFTYYKNYSNNFLSGFVSSTIGQKFEAASTLSLYNTNKVLLGIGGSYTGNLFQFYISTNNILELIQPYSAKNLNLWFGVNFLFSTD